MSTPNPAMQQPVSGWVVTGQAQGMKAGPDGQITEGVDVYFRTGQGVDGSVFVPNNLYSPATVREMIATRAGQMDAVSALSAPKSS